MAADCKSAVLWDYEGSNPSLCTSKRPERGRLKQDRPAGMGAMSGAGRVERKYRVALALYVVLGILAWTTLGADAVPLFGRVVPLRVLPILVLGGFALRTWVAMQAERIRREAVDRAESKGEAEGRRADVREV